MTEHHIFIASSAEMRPERLELNDMLMDMDCHAVVWESMDSALRAERKEDEYLRRLRECEVCITMFWRALGQYTEEELRVALAEQQAGRLPRHNFVMLKTTDTPSPELNEFLAWLRAEHPDIIHAFTTSKELRSRVERLLLSDVFSSNSTSQVEGHEHDIVSENIE